MKFLTTAAQFVTAGLLLAFVGCASAQQAYPTKPIHIIVTFAPGGSNDILARLYGPKLNEAWGQPVIVDNRPGANGVNGAVDLVKAAPDGHTLMMHSSTHIITPLLVKVPYDMIKDFAPVSTVCLSEDVLVINPSVPANNVRELIALAKSKPGELNFGSSGSGGSLHLAGELFSILAGIKMQHIPYKGALPVVTDLMGGQVQLFFSPPIVVLPHIKSGKIKALAVSGKHRMDALPQVPTFTEAGLPGFEVAVWQGFFAPAATPKPIIDKLAAEIARITALPDVNKALANQGMEPFVAGPAQFAAMIKADVARWGKTIKTANVKLED